MHLWREFDYDYEHDYDQDWERMKTEQNNALLGTARSAPPESANVIAAFYENTCDTM